MWSTSSDRRTHSPVAVADLSNCLVHRVGADHLHSACECDTSSHHGAGVRRRLYRDFPSTGSGIRLIVSLIFNAALRIRSLAGSRVLLNFLLGRYHRPLRESRIFMFLDVADSTKLAEQLGDERVQSLIGRFFFDIATPIANYGGETHRYIGDEVVVTWTLARGQRQANCLECVRAISRLMHEQETVIRGALG